MESTDTETVAVTEENEEALGIDLEPVIWTRTGNAGAFQYPMRGTGNVIVPSWLIELADETVDKVRDLKQLIELISDYKSLESDAMVLRAFLQEMLGIETSEEEVQYILEHVPMRHGAVSFGHFLYALANPTRAKTKNVLYPGESRMTKREPISVRSSKVAVKSFHDDLKSKSTKSINLPRNAGSTKVKKYSDREKLLYSSIVLFYMNDLTKKVRPLNAWPFIPLHDLDLRKQRAVKGHGIHTIGVKNMTRSEWDLTSRPVPNYLQDSPYLKPNPFVQSRVNGTRIEHLHYIIKAPKGGDGKITLLENRGRLKRALRYLFVTKNDIICLLPDIQYLLHFAEPIEEKLEEVVDKVTANDNFRTMHWINREFNKIFEPIKVPKQFKPYVQVNRVPLSTSRILREYLEHLHRSDWEIIRNERVIFLNKIWQTLKWGSIPDGLIKDALFKAFTALLPFIPTLPTPRPAIIEHHIHKACC